MTQEVLLVVYQKLDTLTDPAAFNGWAKRITATRCMNAVSRTHVDLQFSEDEDGNSFIDTIEELDEQKIPDAALDNAQTARMIVELIDALPKAQRICTYLYYYDELSVQEIAALTNATENTVKSRLNYARKAIKEGVLEHEKRGVRLYGLSPLPFLLYYLRMAAQTEASEAAAAACVTCVMATNTVATGTAAAVAASTAQVASAATAAGTAIPAACSDGDRLLTPDYIYQYGYEYGESQQIEYDEEAGAGAELGPRFINSDIEGWGVCVRSTSKTSYAALLS